MEARTAFIRDMIKTGATFTAAFLVRDALVALSQMIVTAVVGIGVLAYGKARGRSEGGAAFRRILPPEKLTELVSHVATAGAFLAVVYDLVHAVMPAVEE
jgi:hypothetical protein